MTQYVLSLSYGKDSMACIHVIRDILHWQLDRIITTDVWFDDDTPADLPEVWDFKREMDELIKQRYGIEVEHLCASRGGTPTTMSGTSTSDQKQEMDAMVFLANESRGATNLKPKKLTYKDIFYRHYKRGDNKGRIYGFPVRGGNTAQANSRRGNYCTQLKQVFSKEVAQEPTNVVQYLGIANDEPERIVRHINKPNILLPLVEAGWDEDMCGLWCKYSGMLSPTYSHSYRDGCWFCHNQGVDQLRYLRKNYRYLWDKLMKLDDDSPVTFHADGRTVHDFDRRFQLEDEGYVQTGKKFRWAEVENAQMNIMQFMGGEG